MNLLAENEYPSIVSWLHHGKSFIIWKPKRFTAEVLPRYFPQSKFTSFTRKLNRWGFTRITRGVETGAYFHNYFRRDNPDFCLRMTCRNPRFLKNHLKEQHLLPPEYRNPPSAVMPSTVMSVGEQNQGTQGSSEGLPSELSPNSPPVSALVEYLQCFGDRAKSLDRLGEESSNIVGFPECMMEPLSGEIAENSLTQLGSLLTEGSEFSGTMERASMSSNMIQQQLQALNIEELQIEQRLRSIELARRSSMTQRATLVTQQKLEEFGLGTSPAMSNKY